MQQLCRLTVNIFFLLFPEQKLSLTVVSEGRKTMPCQIGGRAGLRAAGQSLGQTPLGYCRGSWEQEGEG